jgi:hypothetical protein
MDRPYKLVRDWYRPVADPSQFCGRIIASYATLGAAVAAARRRSPEGLEVMRGGAVLRTLSHHGLPSDPRWDAE